MSGPKASYYEVDYDPVEAARREEERARREERRRVEAAREGIRRLSAEMGRLRGSMERAQRRYPRHAFNMSIPVCDMANLTTSSALEAQFNRLRGLASAAKASLTEAIGEAQLNIEIEEMLSGVASGVNAKSAQEFIDGYRKSASAAALKARGAELTCVAARLGDEPMPDHLQTLFEEALHAAGQRGDILKLEFSKQIHEHLKAKNAVDTARQQQADALLRDLPPHDVPGVTELEAALLDVVIGRKKLDDGLRARVRAVHAQEADQRAAKIMTEILREQGHDVIEVPFSTFSPSDQKIYYQRPSWGAYYAEVATEKGVLTCRLIRAEEDTGTLEQQRRDREMENEFCNLHREQLLSAKDKGLHTRTYIAPKAGDKPVAVMSGDSHLWKLHRNRKGSAATPKTRGIE